MIYLYAAYAATWMIHIVYLGWMAMRYRRLQREIQELRKTDRPIEPPNGLNWRSLLLMLTSQLRTALE
jgi:CcmD family protein